MKTLNLGKYKFIIFDLFHTLTYPEAGPNREYEWQLFNMSEEHWIEHSIKTYLPRGRGEITEPGQIVRNILISAGIQFTEKQLEQATHRRIVKFKECLINIEPKIVDTIQWLYRREFKLCLLSNADAIDKMGWDSSPLKKYFSQAVFSCDTGFTKPEPAIYRIALDKMKASPENTLFIGDGGSNEFEGAKALKIDTLMTTWFIKNLWPERITELREWADFKIDHLEELMAYYGT